jgi:hypothetical protein
MYKVLQVTVSCERMVLPNDDMKLGNNEECSAIDSFFDICPTLLRRGRHDMHIWGYLLDVCILRGTSTQLCDECIAAKPLRMEIGRMNLIPMHPVRTNAGTLFETISTSVFLHWKSL